MGRSIVPHRDIVESEESDFDVKSYTDSGDILIIIPDDVDVASELSKENKLRELRNELEFNQNRDYITNRESSQIRE